MTAPHDDPFFAGVTQTSQPTSVGPCGTPMHYHDPQGKPGSGGPPGGKPKPGG